MLSIKTLKHTPSNIVLWDSLAELNSNFFQSTVFDKMQVVYNQIPVYFELWNGEMLISGVKMYYWESRKFGFVTSIFSKYFHQYSEIIYYSNLKEDVLFFECKKKLQEAVDNYILMNKIVSVQVTGVYGNTEMLLSFKSKAEEVFNYNSGYVNLCDVNCIDFFNNFNRNTKRNLKKAEENQLVFSELNDNDIFHETLDKIFSQQKPINHPPHKKFTDIFFKMLTGKAHLATHQVKFKNEILAVSLFVISNKNAYSLFGGSVKNEIGAGHFLYYELMKIFQKNNICKFYFGQVSQDKNELNKKFSVGISGFKRGFGLTEIPTYKKLFIIRPFKNRIWIILLRIQKLIQNV